MLKVLEIFNKMVRELLYPFFIECCNCTDDSYWKTIFEDLAYGITPYMTYISKDMLICNHKDREFAYRICKKDPMILYNEIIGLFKTKLGLLSYVEIISKRNDIEQFYDNPVNTNDWVSIKRKTVKEIYIEKFIIDMKSKYSLNIAQTRRLSNVIFLAFVYKVITPADIVIDNGVIEYIDGIEISENGVVLKRNIYDIQINLTTEIVVDKKLMSEEWSRFLANLKKVKQPR